MNGVLRLLWSAVKQSIFWWKSRSSTKSIAVEELPEKLRRQRLYLIGESTPWAAALLCPCGCGEVIHLSLLQYDFPSWCLQLDSAGIPTLSPSVWRTKGCKSHFFLKSGKIVWCSQNS
jgi:Family of unknown function (DUF6527)